MNKIFLIGNLTRDPESRTSQAGNQVCRFGLAVSRRRGRQEGQPEADFFNCVAFGKTAEIAQRYLLKGRKVSIMGTLTLNTFDGQDGQRRTSADVAVDELEFLPSGAPGQSTDGTYPAASGTAAQGQNTGGYYGQTQPRPVEAPKPAAPSSYAGFSEVDEDELPF
ncbi:MAG: single-stranded DNA-binding protein [Oscillospiraceae bacterium]|jgi:single-strand DNA-binding protein|nr:single-stranded DNA-binding protein [Oscillospiraceae bacterium]